MQALDNQAELELFNTLAQFKNSVLCWKRGRSPIAESRFSVLVTLTARNMSKRKAPTDTPNQEFVDFLIELSNFERNVNRNVFKYNAYRKAAGVLAKLDYRIQSGDEARKLDGIGDKIAKKIDEFIKTGKLQKLEKIRSDDSNTAINELTRIAGIGPAKAKDLVDSGINSIEDLRQNQDSLTKAQKIGLKHFEDFEKRIPREEISEIESIIKQELKGLDPKYKGTICGSYRRGLASSGDVDVLLTHKDYSSADAKSGKTKYLRKVVEALEESGLVTDTISHGDTKFMGVCKQKKIFRRLDIRLLPIDQYYCGILYFTGSDMFNKQMRAHALDIGFTLNEYTLRPMDAGHVPLEPLPVSSEEDVFDYLSMDFKEPHERSA